jgi:hypothetical protein
VTQDCLCLPRWAIIEFTVRVPPYSVRRVAANERAFKPQLVAMHIAGRHGLHYVAGILSIGMNRDCKARKCPRTFGQGTSDSSSDKVCRMSTARSS